MHRLSFFAALALVFGSTQALAECNNVGCVRPTDPLEKLAKTAERTFSVIRVMQPANVFSLCGTGSCATEPALTPLPKNCGRAGCATPVAAAANDGAKIHASTLVADGFAAVAERRMRLPPAVPWTEWAERWGFGGLYKSATIPNG
jgi:hypothetical protein